MDLNNWLTKIKAHPATLILTTLTALFAFTATITKQYETIQGWYLGSYTSSNEYQMLDKINVTLTHATIINTLGEPQIKKSIEKLGSTESFSEELYGFPKFYVQVIYDSNEEVIFYAVTSRLASFHPPLPCSTSESGLGEKTFHELNPDFVTDNLVYAYATSKHYNYAESYYAGGSCKYHNYYFGYNDRTGILYGDTQPTPLYMQGVDEDEVLSKFRNAAKPNLYAVLKVGVDLYEFLNPPWETEIGILFLDAENLPN